MNHKTESEVWLADAETYFQDGRGRSENFPLITVLLSIAHSLIRIANNLASSPEDKP